jgi:peptidylprolyl isomerase
MDLITKTRLTLITSVFAFLAFTACTETNTNAPANKPAETKPPTSGNVKTAVKPEPDSQVAVIETVDYNRIVIELYPNIAPKEVERFKTLISEKFYDGTAIHRIDASLGIIQGGDPVTKTGNKSGWGTGSSKYGNLPAEFSDIPYDRGIVGAARTNDINTANCQWFITLKRQPAFDKKYTVFGKVIDGLKNAEIIMTAPTEQTNCANPNDPACSRPADKVVIKSVTLQPRANFPAS